MPTDKRKRLSRAREVKLSPEVLRLLAGVPDARTGAPRKKFTAQQDALILAGYETKNRRALAEAVGCNEATMRRRWRELRVEPDEV